MIWPHAVLIPQTTQWDLSGGRVSGGRSLGGVAQEGRFDGGPLWTLSLNGIRLRNSQMIRLAKALQGLLDSGSPIEVGTCDGNLAPLPAGAGFGTVPHSDDTPFSDTSEYEQSPITASFAADAALRATTVTLSLSVASALIGGEEFSVINGDTVRKHRITQVTGGTDSQPIVSITPPLRAAVESGQAVDFNNPRCTMKLMSMPIPVELSRFGNVDAQFVEYFE